ncbi:MAG: tyrosine-type recombinase/integrase [Lachnospiraceae bacterium]|nr:tyrosine-type recombinase/integrase [Lachnospiraceae bacterium]
MANLVIRKYVKKHHHQAISHLTNSTGKNKDRWKTFVYENGKRKEIKKSSEEDLYKALYDFYQFGRTKPLTLKDMLDQLAEYKRDLLGRSEQTVYLDRRHFSEISESLQNKAIADVTEEDVQKWLMESYLPKKPKDEALRKQFQLLSQLFEFGIRKKACLNNPMKYLDVHDYYRYCDQTKKQDEDREFSEEELDLIHEEVCKTPENPRSLMVLVAMETGLRSGELAAIHVSDIENEYLHIHRQQRIIKLDNDKYDLEELPYTKDERTHPHNGRRVPITEECREAINLALNLPGESEYLFHDSDGNPINKDSYNLYLRRLCTRLGIVATNNHAFRIAFNSRMIHLGFSSAERALIMGHAVTTNESHYSISDKRRLDGLKKRIVEDGDAR